MTAEHYRDCREHSGALERYIVSETPQTDSETPQKHTETPQSTLRHRGDIRYTPRDIEEVGNNHIYIKEETSEQATAMT